MSGEAKQLEWQKNEEESTPAISAKLLLSVIQKEYDIELDKKKTFETRAGALIGFSGALLAFFAKSIDFSGVYKNFHPDLIFAYTFIFIVFFLGPLVLLFLAIFYFLQVLSPGKYIRIDLDNFEEANPYEAEEKTAYIIMRTYKGTIEQNKKVNNTKGRYFTIGVRTLSISILLITLMFIISNIIPIGG